jgi:hypothetical protein
MLFWTYAGALFLFSAVGEYLLGSHRREFSRTRYRRFLLACAALFLALPATTGDWTWIVPLLPASVFAMQVRLRQATRRRAEAGEPHA